MEFSNLFISLLIYSFLISTGAHGSSNHHHYHQKDRPTKLFIFGDSYADTGNVMKAFASSWKEPYGMTFPSKPAGRFSDGRVLTDYIAKFLHIPTPVAYRWMKYGGSKLRHGMNFAYGGSGVFDTFGAILPNMTTQIDFFEKLINKSTYTKRDLKSSVVLVSLVGNDYSTYLENGGTTQGLQKFIPTVTTQLALNLKRIGDLGIKKIAVTGLQPLGCLPRFTVLSSFQQCNATQNFAVGYHNLLLQKAVEKLNNETKHEKIFILDLYNSFTKAIDQKAELQFDSPILKPCCMGTCDGCSCGSVDENGTKLYSLCKEPNSTFFWDSSHPTQAGWHAVYTTIKSSLRQFFKH